MLVSINPATGESIAEYQALNEAQMNERIEAAEAAGEAWREKSIEERGDILKAVAASLRDNKAKLANLMTVEMGKPAKEAGPEVEKAAWCAEHYADHAAEYLSDQYIESDASRSYVHHQPLGTLLGILPWNAPLWIAFRYLAPALMAGNTCAIKHDPHVAGCSAGIIEAFEKAGAPKDIVVDLPLKTETVEKAIRHPAIQALSFTGSAKAGGIVASIAASEIKHSVLELGGSDPFLVLADADLEAAADVAKVSRIINAGQSCIASKRIIVDASVYDQFVELVKTRLEALKMGDPAQEDTDVGPIAREDLRANLHRQVQDTIKAGAKCLLGGEMPAGKGFFYPVTLLTDVTPDMCAFREETFGPVMVISKAENTEDAIKLANDSEYGLGAGIWSKDVAAAEKIAMRINAGQVAINGIVKTDPRLPSGGIKHSGYGRELGPHGIREFVNAKQIWIK